MALSTDKSVVLKFLADLEGMRKGLLAGIKDLENLLASNPLKIYTVMVGPDGKPMGPGQGMPGSGSVGGSAPTPGQYSTNFGARDKLYQQYNQQPMTEFQALRQQDPNFHYLEAQRAMNSRSNSMNVMTGGKDGSTFLSDKIAELSKQNNPAMQGTVAAITGLRDKFDELTRTIHDLNETEKKGGTAKELADVATKREDATRAQQQILQSANGFGGGGSPPPGMIERIVDAVAAYATIKGTGSIIQSGMRGRGAALESHATIADMHMRVVGAAQRMNAEDIFSTLDPEARRYAATIGGIAPYTAGVGKLTEAAATGAAAGQTKGAKAGMAAGAGNLLVNSAGAGASWLYGGHPMDAISASTTVEALAAIARVKGGDVAMGDAYFKEAPGRTNYGRSFGVTAAGMRGMSTDVFQRLTRESGVSEDEQREALLGMHRFTNVKNLPDRLVNQLRNGISGETISRQANGLLSAGGTEEGSFKMQEEIMARAFTRGYGNSPLAQRQADAIVMMASQGGGWSGGSGAMMAERAVRIMGGAFGQERGAELAQGAQGVVMGERNQRGGQQGMVNVLAAKNTIEKFFPQATGAQKAALIMAFTRSPDQFENPAFQKEIRKGYSGELSDDVFDKIQDFNAAEGERLGLRMNPFAQAGVSPGLARLALNSGKAGEIAVASRYRDGLMGGEGLDLEKGTDLKKRGEEVDFDNPLIDQMKAIDIASTTLANGGLSALNAAFAKLGENRGLDAMIKALLALAAGADGYNVGQTVEAESKAAARAAENKKTVDEQRARVNKNGIRN